MSFLAGVGPSTGARYPRVADHDQSCEGMQMPLSDRATCANPINR